MTGFSTQTAILKICVDLISRVSNHVFASFNFAKMAKICEIAKFNLAIKVNEITSWTCPKPACVNDAFSNTTAFNVKVLESAMFLKRVAGAMEIASFTKLIVTYWGKNVGEK